jgi:hypothetical protein
MARDADDSSNEDLAGRAERAIHEAEVLRAQARRVRAEAERRRALFEQDLADGLAPGRRSPESD